MTRAVTAPSPSSRSRALAKCASLAHSRHAPGNGSGIPAGVVHETKRVSSLVGSSACSRARSFPTSGSQHHMGFVALHAYAWPFELRSNLGGAHGGRG